jgi:antitoxin HigA-1
MKMKQVHIVPLSRQALEVLGVLRTINGERTLLFPGERDHAKPMSNNTILSALISVTDFAQRLGVTRVTLSRMLNAKAGVSAEMAVRLAAALGGTAQSWLHLQANYDLWHAEKSLKQVVKKIAPLKLAA